MKFSPIQATMAELIPQVVEKIEPYRESHPTAAEELEQLQQLLRSWQAYRDGKQVEALTQFAAAVAHDTPTLNPSADAAFVKFLSGALNELEGDSRIDQAFVAAAIAFFCLSNPQAIGLKETTAGRKLDRLAAKHPDSWYVQYCSATWRVLRQDHQGSAEALTAAIAAGGPCGMYYTRARVHSNLGKRKEAAADFAKFLEIAPPDHRSRPDAFYALVLEDVGTMAPGTKPDMEAAMQHYQAGQAAEKAVGPWVGYQGGEAKMVAQLVVSSPAARGQALR